MSEPDEKPPAHVRMGNRALVLVDGKLGFDGPVDEGIHFLRYDDSDGPDQNEDDLGAEGGQQVLPRLGALHERLGVGVVATDLHVALVVDGDLEVCPSSHVTILPRPQRQQRAQDPRSAFSARRSARW